MNAVPLGHLLWKEYRAIRAFWLALIVLSVGLQYAAAELFQDPRLIVLNVALATPVFFALGCIGTAFALEKEEGTYDWLRASPATDGQVFFAKLALCAFGAVTMYAVLWPGAMWLTSWRLPEGPQWHGMLALWPLAAVEAIAWGMFFSLRSERPLPAIILAMVVTSLVVHLAAMPHETTTFSFGRYLSAVPLRLAIILPVLAIDVYLGLRWLQGEKVQVTPRRTKVMPDIAQPVTRAAQRLDTTGHLHLRDRGMLLGHLLWQHGRQSWRLMVLMVTLQIVVTFLAKISGLAVNNFPPVIPLIAFAGLMGASVFLPDQERRGYRFFVEHNVPPRYVWLTRLVPWFLVATFSTLLAGVVWLGPSGPIDSLLSVFDLRGDAATRTRQLREFGLAAYVSFVSLSAATLAFAGGQWISMMVRSGLLAGFFTLLLSAALTLWVAACFAMQLSWVYFVVPVPVIFIFATWLRAPDWISENVTWHGRFKAAAAVILPALVLLAAAPIVRVNQVPKVFPGFYEAAYLSEISPEALAAGKLYARANEALFMGDGGQKSLDLVLEASAAPHVVLANPATLVDWPAVWDESLISLVNQSARRLAAAGQLDQALDRQLTAFKVTSDLASHAPFLHSASYRPDTAVLEAFTDLSEWGAHESQTQARIVSAIERLQSVSVNVLHAEDSIKSNFILCQRYIDGDDRLASTLLGPKSPLIFSRALVARFLPWEAYRELRALNLQVADRLATTARLQSQLRAGEHRVEVFGGDLQYLVYLNEYQPTPFELSPRFGNWANAVQRRLMLFETYRRSTLIILACQAYRLQHGELPHSLDELIGDPVSGNGYFEALPVDPYTGRSYVYFREGLPKPPTPEDQVDFDRSYWSHGTTGKIQVGRPCLWSPGSALLTQEDRSSGNRYGFVYGRSDRGFTTPDYEAWARGQWFPIPLKVPADEPNVEPEPEKADDDKPSGATQDPASDVEALFNPK